MSSEFYDKIAEFFGKAIEDLSDVQYHPKSYSDHWGWHLLLDCSGCNNEMDNMDSVKKFMEELVKILKMNKIGDLIIHDVHGKDGRGISAVQIITTSTLTFHSDWLKRAIYLDCFSCKPYDPKIVPPLVNKYFSPKHIATKFLFRDAGGI